MPVDYRRLVDGLNLVSQQIHDGAAGLATIDLLVGAVREAAGAVGATFTAYSDDGGRVVVAAGELAWALGQPIAADFVDLAQEARPWSRLVDTLPVQVAEPLLGRGVLGIAGHPVHTAQRLVGAIHVYFGETSAEMREQASAVLRIAAALAAMVYGEAATPPTEAAPDDDDRTLFLAVAGHELRTPVTVIKSYAGMLSDRWEVLDDANRRDAARVLNQRADELARLVDRLLGGSVGDSAGGWLVRAVPFDPVEALLQAVREMPAELRRLIRLELPNSLPPAHGDPSMLSSIVAELVTNAVRSMPAGLPGSHTGAPSSPAPGAVAPVGQAAPGSGPYPGGHAATGTPPPPAASIEIQAGADMHTVFFRVLDRGAGIDPTHVERAFERFWRARRGGDPRSGVGLGLYLVRRLVERQNGWVSLRAREGGGTVAEVRLPRADGAFRRPGEA